MVLSGMAVVGGTKLFLWTAALILTNLLTAVIFTITSQTNSGTPHTRAHTRSVHIHRSASSARQYKMCTYINFDKAILIPADLNGSTLDQGVGMSL